MLTVSPASWAGPVMLSGMSPSSVPAPVSARTQTTPARYVERLLPSVSIWLGITLFSVLVYISLFVVDYIIAGLVAPVVLIVGFLIAWMTSPTLRVTDTELHAGRAHIALPLLGQPAVLDREGLRGALGPAFDARTFACLHLGARHALWMDVLDETDPAPGWLISTRRPAELAAALAATRA